MKALRRPRAALAGLLLLAATAQAATVAHTVVERYQHCTQAFTEGLQLVGDELFESSGLYRESYVARTRLDCSVSGPRRALAPEVFAEGLTVLGDKAYLLSWQSGIGFVLDRDSFAIQRSFTYEGEGWGLTHDAHTLIMSDGTARLRFLDPQTLQTVRTLDVTENGKPLVNLNELEWIPAGELGPQPRLLANIWLLDQIAVIDPQTGVVTARIDLGRLNPRRRAGEDVLNGIAFDPRDNTLLVTGKRWRYLWRLRLNAPLP